MKTNSNNLHQQRLREINNSDHSKKLIEQIKRKYKRLEEQIEIKREVAEDLAFRRQTHPLFKKNKNRNKKCFCGSGRKYKKCCLPKITKETAFIATKGQVWKT